MFDTTDTGVFTAVLIDKDGKQVRTTDPVHYRDSAAAVCECWAIMYCGEYRVQIKEWDNNGTYSIAKQETCHGVLD